MKNTIRRKKKIFRLLVLAALAGLAAMAAGAAWAEPQGNDTLRPDIVTIDDLKAAGRLTQPAVTFLHDKHTAALAKNKDLAKKDCAACHIQPKEGGMRLTFMQGEDKLTFEQQKDVFHTNCIGCHMSLAAAGQKSGPSDAQCRACHLEQPVVTSTWQPITVDKRLHFRHAATREKNQEKCADCHHLYDEAAKKTVGVKKEDQVPGACVYCHKETTSVVAGRDPESIRSLRLAAHGQCVTCHRATAATGKDVPTGPSTCAGCHGPLDQKAIADNTAKKVPKDADLRIKRGQPDFGLIRPAPPEKPVIGADGQPVKAMNMPPVPFAHKDHEAASETCVACHHAALTSCAGACHTLAGAKEGGFVPLEAALHKKDSDKSCAGCHAEVQKKPECAGCHAFLNVKRPGDTAACASCHAKPDPALEPAVKAVLERPKAKDTAEAEAALAGKLIASYRQKTVTYPAEDIPETVTVGTLAKDYQPSVFPHRKIVLSLVAGMKDSKLAGAYHEGDGAVCRGCHHNSPATKTPPRCGNCHPAVADASGAKPALKAAYHGQCMGCHAKMGLEGKVAEPAVKDAKPVPTAVDCATGCHKEAKKAETRS